VAPLATLVLAFTTLTGSARAEAFLEHPPCPIFTKQVPMTHTWDDARGQWSCRYILTIIANGLRDAKGHCVVKHVETERFCVGAGPAGEPQV